MLCGGVLFRMRSTLCMDNFIFAKGNSQLEVVTPVTVNARDPCLSIKKKRVHP